MAEMRCFDCGKEFKDDERVYEYTVGVYSVKDGYVTACESFEAWCKACDTTKGEK